MKGIAEGFQNESSRTRYPFSSACTLVDDDGGEMPSGILSDAMLYPVVEKGASAVVRLVGITHDEISIACGPVRLTGSWDGAVSSIDVFDDDGRPAGSIVPGPAFADFVASGGSYWFAENADNAVFAAACCCPVEKSGVSSITVVGQPETAVMRLPVAVFEKDGNGAVRPQVYETKETVGSKIVSVMNLKFDVVPYTPPSIASSLPYIRRILVAGKGETLFDAVKEAASTGAFYLLGLSRDDICAAANREESASIGRNVCEKPEPGCQPSPIPTSEIRFWLYPSDVGSVSLIAPDGADFDNALNIRALPGGSIYQQPVALDPDLSQEQALEEIQKLFDTPITSGHGILFEIPGSAGKGSATA